MRILFLAATVSAIAWARPETYRETEDFQYARSSSDEGSKSGYYGAQRGNMAGNYERAHNMDSLAQHQMSGAINQVEGELGDASKTRAGSVYTAANSRGVYGSGRYDLSNLQGRNFGDSSSVDNSHSSMSSAYNQHAHNSDWRSQSQRSGYGASNQLGESSLRAADGASGYGAANYAGSSSHSSGYHSATGHQSQSGYHSLNNYDQNNLNEHSSNGYGAQTSDQARRYTVVAPVRLVGRPGTHIAIPVYGQAYDTHSASSLNDQHFSNSQTYASQSASTAFDQNAINSEAEVLNNNQQHISSVPTVPVTNGKHYSSSYNYHKAWERRSETTDLPVSVASTVSPLPRHSELNEDIQSASGSDHLQQANSQNSYAGSAYNSANRYNSYAQSGSSQSRHHSDYSSQHKSAADANSNAYTQGTYGTHAGPVPLVDSQPKNYQSSYSYHKSWEKQGDPYVIVPPTNGEASQRIISGVKNHASSHHGSQYQQHYSHDSAADCDTLCRSRRAVRSYSTSDYYQQNQEDLGQEAQTGWEENLEQQTQQHIQPEKLEDLGQQTQQSWGDLQQQSESEKLEDLGQQTQQSWGNIEQHQRPQKLNELGQQTQQSWDDFQQQGQPQKLEDFGQQTQQSWDNFQQQSPPQKLALGQQIQQSEVNFQQQHRPQKLEDLGQQTQGKWHELDQESDHNLEDLGQQTQQSWDKSNIEQQVSRQNLEDLGQQTRGQWDKIESNNKQSEPTFENFDNLGQQTQSKWESQQSLGQQTQQTWNSLGNIEQQNKPQQTENLGQQTQNKWDSIENLGQQVQSQWNNIIIINKTRHTDTTNTEQQTQTQFEYGDQIKPNRVHAEDNTQYTFNTENSDLNNPDHPAFWGLTDEHRHENIHNYSQHNGYNNNNSYSNSQTHGASWQEETNDNTAQTTNNNPLQSLWDKIDNMEQQSEHSSNENQQHTGYETSQHSYYGQENRHENNWEYGQSSYNRNQHEIHYSGYQPPFAFNNTVDKPNDQKRQENRTEKPRDNDFVEKPEPAEIGRGDIGAEDDSLTEVTTSKTLPGLQTYTTEINIEKTPEEIEALSLSRGTEEDTVRSDSLSVLSINQQKWLEDQRERATNEFNQIGGSRSKTSTTVTTPLLLINENTTSDSFVNTVNHHKKEKHSESDQDYTNTYPHHDNHNTRPKNESNHYLEQPEEIQQQSEDTLKNNLGKSNTIHQFDDFGQQNQDISQNNFQQLGQHNQNFDQQNTELQMEDFGQQRQLDEGQLGQSFDQQSTGQDFVDFGKQSQDLSQHHVQKVENFAQHNLDQQETGQELTDFGQQTQDLNQQNLQQFKNLGQYNVEQENTGQQLENIGQQSQDLTQQNLQLFKNVGHHGQHFEQENTGQQLQDFGQQNQNLNQQNLQQFKNLGYHNQQNTGQQQEDFGQQSQDLNQENLKYENLGQHSQNLDHQAREFIPNSNIQPIQEEKITSVSNPGSQTHPKQDVEVIPPLLTTTEKPGFWKSVGNKFSSAKDSVASWFTRS